MRFLCLLISLLAFLALACDGGEGQPQATELASSSPTSIAPARPVATPTRPPGTSHYRNPAFGVEFDYPRSWVPDPLYSSGIGGYLNVYRDPRGREFGWFNVGAAGAPTLTLDEVVQRSTEHKLKPYGEHPEVLSLTLAVGEARLIFPDEEPAAELFDAQLIVSYPSPIHISTGSYNYFSLVVHKDFIRAVADTLRFTEGSATPRPSP